MPAARKMVETVRFNILAIMTAAYGVGQIVGPPVSNALYARWQSFDASLVLAALTLVVAAAGCIGRETARRVAKWHRADLDHTCAVLGYADLHAAKLNDHL